MMVLCRNTGRSINEEGNRVTDEERYLFDLQGYLVLRGVLTQQEVTRSRIGSTLG